MILFFNIRFYLLKILFYVNIVIGGNYFLVYEYLGVIYDLNYNSVIIYNIYLI